MRDSLKSERVWRKAVLRVGIVSGCALVCSQGGGSGSVSSVC